jgi:hypothetical protein
MPELVMTAPGVVLGRCNPYGAETGGPKRILGGLYGPNSAKTEGMHLPENVAQGEWLCPRRADVRCRMVCRCSHRGQVMELCTWHDDKVFGGEWVAGTLRQVSRTVRQHGHYEEIQKRQSGSCPKCLFPPPYGELMKEVQAWQATLSNMWFANLWRTPAAQEIRTRIDDAGALMDLAFRQGIIHNCPLTLVPVS